MVQPAPCRPSLAIVVRRLLCGSCSSEPSPSAWPLVAQSRARRSRSSAQQVRLPGLRQLDTAGDPRHAGRPRPRSRSRPKTSRTASRSATTTTASIARAEPGKPVDRSSSAPTSRARSRFCCTLTIDRRCQREMRGHAASSRTQVGSSGRSTPASARRLGPLPGRRFRYARPARAVRRPTGGGGRTSASRVTAAPRRGAARRAGESPR